MQIGVVQRDDTRSVLTSSGTLYYMTRALGRHVGNVVQLGPDETIVSKALLNAGKAFNKISVPLFKKRISPIHQRLLSKHAANVFSPRIAAAQCDVLFAPFASVEIADLSVSSPIIYHTDMTWADAIDYYPIYSSLFPFAKQDGEYIQRKALEKSSAVILPTEWAARAAVEHYGLSPDVVNVVPYGANFEEADIPSQTQALERHLHEEVRLLWIGVDWVRKGGTIAYACLMSLLERNVNARLTVCGCTPPAEFEHSRIEVIPFLSKQDPVQRGQLSQLFLQASFFLLPTSSEAAAIVLCEASAHGLPSLVSDTGGMSGVVADGVNGYLLPADAAGSQYADKVVEIVADQEAYRQVVLTSRQTFEEKLNWDAWGRAVAPIFEQVLDRRAATSI
jgi:glycosyltransferase involved in cell wall biosynthesis